MATRARPRVVVPSTRRLGARLAGRAPRAIAARQVSGEGAALVERLRACADVTATAFENSESTRNNARANDVLEGLIRKARHQGDAFALIEAYDESDGRTCGCADVTALSVSGRGASAEGVVRRVPEALGLTERARYAYLSGMCVRRECRRRGVGKTLLEACERCARKMEPRPCAMALHVDGDNEGAIALYEGRGYARAVEREVDDAFGRASRALGGLWGGKKTKKILMWKWL